MGYELSIVRDTGTPISFKEWTEYIDTDNDLEAVDNLQGNNPTDKPNITLQLQKAVVYKNQGSIFIYSDNYNMISVNNPNQKTIDKMIKIGITLKGQVQGEEGELYNELSQKEDRDYEFVSISKPKKWFEFWKS